MRKAKNNYKKIMGTSNKAINNDIKNSYSPTKIPSDIQKKRWYNVASSVKKVIRDNSIPEKDTLMNKIYDDMIKSYLDKENEPSKKVNEYEGIFINLAKYFDEKNEQEKELELLKRIKDSKNPTIRKRVRRQASLTLEKELLKDSANFDIVSQFADILAPEKSENDALENNSDDRKDIENLLTSLFGKEFEIEQLELGELEKYLSGVKTKTGHGEGKEYKEYPKDIHVEKRIKFFKEELNIEDTIRYCDEGTFAGSILLNIKDSDMVIVERLFEIYKDSYALANQSSSKSSATYVLPKDKVLDMLKFATKRDVKEQLESNGRKDWKTIIHNKNWKENVRKAIKCKVTGEQDSDENGHERLEEDMNQKIQGLCTRIADLDAEQQEANTELQQAIREEKEAIELVKQAIAKQQAAETRRQETEERQIKITQERVLVQKKLKEFLEL